MHVCKAISNTCKKPNISVLYDISVHSITENIRYFKKEAVATWCPSINTSYLARVKHNHCLSRTCRHPEVMNALSVRSLERCAKTSLETVGHHAPIQASLQKGRGYWGDHSISAILQGKCMHIIIIKTACGAIHLSIPPRPGLHTFSILASISTCFLLINR